MLVRAKEVAFTKLLTPNLKKRLISLAYRYLLDICRAENLLV